MKKHNKIFEYYLYPFFGGAIILSIIIFLVFAESFKSGLLTVLIGSTVFSLGIGSLLLIVNKYIRPSVYKFFLHHKNLQQLDKLGLNFNETMNCYFGTYRKFDVQVLCHYDKLMLVETEYVINIFFEKIETKNVKEIRQKELLNRNNLAEFFIQKAFTFKFIPPSNKKLSDTINDFIDILERNNLKPVRLKDLGELFNNVA